MLQNQVYMSIVPPLDPGEQAPCHGSCTSGSHMLYSAFPTVFCIPLQRQGLSRAGSVQASCPEPGAKPVNHGPLSTLQGTLWLSIWWRGSTRCSHRHRIMSLWAVLAPVGPDPRPGVAASWVGSIPFVKTEHLSWHHMWLSCQNDADMLILLMQVIYTDKDPQKIFAWSPTHLIIHQQ